MSDQHKRIVIFTPQDAGFWSDLIHGLGVYALQNRTWTFEFAFWLDIRIALQRYSKSKPHGLIIDPIPKKCLPELHQFGIPFITCTERWGEETHRVSLDDDAIGQMAAAYYLERGFRHFAFCGYHRVAYSVRREAGYRRILESGHYHVHAFRGVFSLSSMQKTELACKQWLDSLPKPCAVFASNDMLALRVNQLCRELTIKVPEELALLGVDNNTMLCDFTHPPLSSINANAAGVGYQAGILLERLMSGQVKGKQTILVPPVGVITRQSTNIMAVEDPAVTEALNYIQNHAHEPISVTDLLNAIPIARRALEKKFHKVLGRSPRAQITRSHIERAKQLLSHTDLQMPQIAKQSGFMHAAQLSAVFRREVGMTPTDYRRKNRLTS